MSKKKKSGCGSDWLPCAVARGRINVLSDRGLAAMPYVVSWPDNTFLAEFTGIVTAREVEAVNHAFSGDARMDTVRYSIWDMTLATAVDMPGDEVVYAAAFDKGVTAVRKSMRGALIASNTDVRRCIEEYLAAAADLSIDWDTRLFHDMAAARAWLDDHS